MSLVLPNVRGIEPALADRAEEMRQLRHVAEEFESLFLQMLIQRMRDSQLDEGFFGEGTGTSVYEGMLDQHLGESLASGSPLGIADLLLDQWANQQGHPLQAARQQLNTLQAQQTYEWGHSHLLPQLGQNRISDDAFPAIPTPNEAEKENDPFVMSRGFGWGRDPFDGSRRFHGGVDFAAPEGTPVLAARAGRVIEVDRDAGYGLQVVVEHRGGMTTRYAHLSGAGVRPGEWVSRRQTLGQVGSTGRSTGPHLHFETRLEGRKIDPSTLGPGPLGPQVLAVPADKEGRSHAEEEYRR